MDFACSRIIRSIFIVAFLFPVTLFAATPFNGVTSGSFNVSPSGAATYAIPIMVPPGTNGMQPNLSLVYNSQGGNGMLGMGWGIGGLSVIHRCGSSIALDNTKGGVYYDNRDNFCLNGERLIAIDGTEYRTQHESWQKIVASDSTSNPESFTIYGKDGSQQNYIGIKAAAPHTTINRLWVLSEVKDINGNSYTISYEQNASQYDYWPTRIDYTTNASAGQTLPYNAVTFTYESRPDLLPIYEAGSVIEITQRLAKIETYAGSTLGRSYQLVYDNNGAPIAGSGASRLVSVQECVNATECLPPTNFNWEQNGNNDGKFGSLMSNSPSTTGGLFVRDGRHGEPMFADVNGDGKADAVVMVAADPTRTSFGTRVYVSLAKGNGNFGPLIESQPSTSGGLFVKDGRHGEPMFADVNGDGNADAVVMVAADSTRSAFGTRVYVSLSNGDGTFGPLIESQPSTSGGLYNGDGRHGEPTFADVNGDGKADAVVMVAANANNYPFGTRVYVSLSNGDGTFGPLKVSAPSTSGGLYNGDGRHGEPTFADVNGDGNADAVVMVAANAANYAFGTRVYVSLSNGDGTFGSLKVSAPSTTGGLYNGDSRHGEPTFADVNGDGKADAVVMVAANAADYAFGSRVYVSLSKGDGTFGMLKESAPSTTGGLYSGDRRHGEPMFADVNGDGKADAVVMVASDSRDNYVFGTRVYISLSKGNGTFAPLIASVPSSSGGFYDGDGRHGEPTFADVTGDGKAEAVLMLGADPNDYGFGTLVYASTPALGNDSALLNGVTNSLGTQTSISYKPLTDSSVYTKGTGAVYPYQDVQYASRVVDSYTQPDGLGGTNVTTYKYTAMKYHVTAGAFLGFASTEVTSPDGSVTKTTYNQSWDGTEGTVNHAETIVAGVKVQETNNTWQVVEPQSPLDSRVKLALNTESTTTNRELNGNVVTNVTVTTTHDAYGYPTQIVTDSGSGYRKIVTNTYQYDVANWRLGQLSRVVMTAEAPGETTQTHTTSFTFNLNGRIESETIEPDDDAYKLVTTFGYDAFGNRISKTVSGANTTSRTDSQTFDTLGQFITSRSNALGHSETLSFDPRYGSKTSLTGPNGLTASWGYDTFGRQIQELRADGTADSIAYYDCTEDPLCNTAGVNNEAYYTQQTSTAKPVSYIFYDSLGRPVRSLKDGFNGSLIESRTEYDHLGRVKGTTNRYFIDTDNLPVDPSSLMWTCVDYDVLGRKISTSIPTTDTCAASKTILSEVAYGGLLTTTTIHNREGDQTKQQRVNEVNQVVEVSDSLSNSNQYHYDAMGRLIEAIDDAGHVIHSSYDLLGRKIAIDDPDMGHWEYSYNVFGEMVAQKDAKGQIATMAYDKLGRITSRSAPGESSAWSYDSCAHGVGKLCSTQNTSNGYQKTIEYDALGRPAATVNTIHGASYRVDRSYDNASRVSITSYPSAFGSRFEVQNCYDEISGYLKEVRSPSTCGNYDASITVYWKANGVNADGKIANESLGNGLNTAYVYDATFGRLADISSGNPGTTLQLNHYDYDNIGNLLSRSFIAQKDTTNTITESFSYDDLNRLTSATISEPGVSVSNSYAYDSIGNITAKSGFGDQYIYGSTRPHAVTEIKLAGVSQASYQYDANGFMVNRNGTNISPTWFGKPASIKYRGNTTNFEYDTSHMRIYQSSAQGSMVYLNPNIALGGHFEQEVENGVETDKHYIYGGAGVVAIYEKTATSSQTKYLLKDHLGSVEVVTDKNGVELERLSYDAFGRRRDVDGSDSLSQIIAQTTHHGFTGHEHLDDYGMIHMNGRLYDPQLGRFLAADPTISMVFSTQGFNRYSYTDNNPLSRLDLSGYNWISDRWYDFTKALSGFVQKARQTVAAYIMKARRDVGARLIKARHDVNSYYQDHKQEIVTTAAIIAAIYVGYYSYQYVWGDAAVKASLGLAETETSISLYAASGAAAGASAGATYGVATKGTVQGGVEGFFGGMAIGASIGAAYGYYATGQLSADYMAARAKYTDPVYIGKTLSKKVVYDTIDKNVNTELGHFIVKMANAANDAAIDGNDFCPQNYILNYFSSKAEAHLMNALNVNPYIRSYVSGYLRASFNGEAAQFEYEMNFTSNLQKDLEKRAQKYAGDQLGLPF